MIKIRFAAFLPIVLLLSSGCASMTPTDQGVVGGGLVGAGAGAAIGNALGNTGAGAAIGAVTGAVTGGLIGNNIEKAEARATATAVAQQQAQQQIGIADVINMAHGHISDPVIITQIRSSGSVFHLTPADIGLLKANGVSDAVVQEMQMTAQRVQPAGYRQPVYVVEPAYPPPPVAVGVGFGYGRGCYRRRCW
ncbi:MAG: glycine zipper domain-containing protein [Gemmataceae bacterium]